MSISRQTLRITSALATLCLPTYVAAAQKGVMLMNRIGPSASTLYVANADGSNPVQLTSLGSTAGTPRWSPDGRHIVFDARIKGNADIYVINADGGSPRRLTVNLAEDNIPSWSSNGKWIYFSSRRTGEFEIWRIPADGGQETQMTHQGGLEPHESPDGKILYYLKRGGADSSVWKIPIEGGKESPVLESANPARFNYWQPFDDGIYFVQRMGNSDDAERIQFFDFATRKIASIGRLEKPTIRRGGGFSVSPDRLHVLVALVDQDDSDIILVENFR